MVQKRKKAQFNLIDAFIIVFIVAVIATAAYLLFGNSGGPSDNGDFDLTFEVRISEVKQEALPFIYEGITVRNSVTGEELGTVISVRTEKSRYYGGVTEDGQGNYVLNSGEYADRYDVYVTISAKSRLDNNGIHTVDQIRMLIGSPVHFKVKSFAALSYVVNVNIPE